MVSLDAQALRLHSSVHFNSGLKYKMLAGSQLLYCEDNTGCRSGVGRRAFLLPLRPKECVWHLGHMHSHYTFFLLVFHS